MLYLLFALGTGTAHAEDATTDPRPEAEDDSAERELEELRARMRAIEAEVDDLAEREEDQGPIELPLDLETRVNGFAGVSVSTYEGSPVGFQLDELILIYTANVDERMTVRTEIAYEPSEEGVALDVETVEFGIRRSDAVRFIIGRSHLPISTWGSQALHGSYRYLPVHSPEVLELEDHGGGTLPMHLTGVQMTGVVPIGYWLGGYILGVSNGRSPMIGGIAQSGDWSWNKALLGRVYLQSPGGLLLAVGAYHDRVDPGSLKQEDVELPIVDSPVQESVGALSFGYDGRAQFDAEVFVVRHGWDGQVLLQTGGYALGGVPIRQFTPYAMVEWVDLDESDPIYSLAGEVHTEQKASLGLRWDAGLRAAFKLQGDLIREEEVKGGEVHAEQGYGAHIQVAGGF